MFQVPVVLGDLITIEAIELRREKEKLSSLNSTHCEYSRVAICAQVNQFASRTSVITNLGKGSYLPGWMRDLAEPTRRKLVTWSLWDSRKPSKGDWAPRLLSLTFTKKPEKQNPKMMCSQGQTLLKMFRRIILLN